MTKVTALSDDYRYHPNRLIPVGHQTDTTMMNLDSIFASYPAEGFQDVWFSALEPNDIVRLFNYACQTYGRDAPTAVWEYSMDRELGIYCKDTKFPHIEYEFEPLLIGGIVLEGVAIRIENQKLAIDFNGGLEYWNPARQATFVYWLRELHRQVPNARLDWAHEGCVTHPAEYESMLLRLAVAGDA